MKDNECHIIKAVLQTVCISREICDGITHYVEHYWFYPTTLVSWFFETLEIKKKFWLKSCNFDYPYQSTHISSTYFSFSQICIKHNSKQFPYYSHIHTSFSDCIWCSKVIANCESNSGNKITTNKWVIWWSNRLRRPLLSRAVQVQADLANFTFLGISVLVPNVANLENEIVVALISMVNELCYLSTYLQCLLLQYVLTYFLILQAKFA